MKKYFDVLRKCRLFREIADEDLIALLGCLGAKVVSFGKKYTIIAEGSPAKYICIMLSGSAQMVRVDYYGNRSIISGIEPSEVFGEAFACAETAEMPVTVIANEPCEVMLIECHRIMHSCSNACGFHQQIIFNLMKNLAVQNLMFHQKLEITACRTTREKLMTYLLLQAKKHGSERFTIPFDRQELADYLEVDRSGLSAEISKLRSEGILTSNRKEFELL
ncbi:MAG: Crp/Fnr family transcriptional regulator [Oscillospiraceae bacterium]|nr:Crp/Fnr family transcriptional regulator [Oscillospiraceae bacterium]MBR4100337.1 Crp/Fnr family transcriptional regulator [Oscillospiraceae bacterium]